MSADPLEHKVPRHVPGEQYEKAYDLANRRGKQVIELRQKLDAAEAALAESRGVATRFRDAVSDIFAKANDDHWSNAAAVKWISTRCLVALEAPHEST